MSSNHNLSKVARLQMAKRHHGIMALHRITNKGRWWFARHRVTAMADILRW